MKMQPSVTVRQGFWGSRRTSLVHRVRSRHECHCFAHSQCTLTKTRHAHALAHNKMKISKKRNFDRETKATFVPKDIYIEIFRFVDNETRKSVRLASRDFRSFVDASRKYFLDIDFVQKDRVDNLLSLVKKKNQVRTSSC